MEDKKFEDQCADLTREFHIKIPCQLAKRVEGYASANNTTITGVVIEALDSFLRNRQINSL